jgi:hypothetical protein
MKTTKIFSTFFVMATVIAMISCSAEDGKDGKDGIDGQQGPQGDPGTANVMYSEWIPIEWGTNDPTYKDMFIEMESPGSDFFDTGGFILMYVKLDNGSSYRLVQVPREEGNLLFDYVYINGPAFPEIGILFYIKSSDGSIITPDFEDGFFVRYILVPGGTPLSDPEARSLGDIDIDNYQAVADHFGLTD